MEVRLIKGGTAKLRLRGKQFNIDKKSKSKFQHSVGEQLVRQYPHDVIFEEIFIPVENLIFDFFIPSLKLAIECQGIQHQEYIKYFHRTKQKFHKQQDRDSRKRDFCELNGFKLMEIYDE